jgi:uncharacterized SAM-dependent methyltransferase
MWPSQTSRRSRALSTRLSAALSPSLKGWIQCTKQEPTLSSALVRQSLLDQLPRIHQSYLYDSRGVELYEKILEQPEYYLPAAEDLLMRSRLDEIAQGAHASSRREAIIELGAGDGQRTLHLIKRIAELSSDPIVYAPADISSDALQSNETHFDASGLGSRDRCVPIHGVHEEAIAAAGSAFGAERALTFLFMGSSLGNLDDDEIVALFGCVHGQLAAAHGRPGGAGRFLVGVDLPHSDRKPAARVWRAYNDHAGWTAAFTLNALSHVNAVAGTDFQPSAWRHVADYDEKSMAIVTHVEALSPQLITVPSDGNARRELRRFAAGERIFMEQSRKFSQPVIRRLGESAGMRLARSWSSDDYLICELTVG